MIKQDLNKARPGYAFLMEESGASGSDNWDLALGGGSARRHDQLPCTACRIGRSASGSSAGCPMAGSRWRPASSTPRRPTRCSVAEKGSGAFMNDRRLRVLRAAGPLPRGLRDRHSRSRGRRRASAWRFARTLGSLAPQTAGHPAVRGRRRSTLPGSQPGASTGYWEIGIKPWDVSGRASCWCARPAAM